MTSLAVRTHWHRPEWPGVVVTVAGWAVLLALVVADPVRVVMPHEQHSPVETLGHAAVMAAAMMTPLVLDQARHVAVSSLWRRRYRAVAGFLAGYLSVWTVVGAAFMFVGSLLVAFAGWYTVAAVSFVVAAFVTCSPSHARWLRQCWSTRPLALSGWRADRDCVRFGASTAVPCIVVTGPLMWAAAIGQSVLVMAAVTAVMALERRRPPREARRLVPSVLALGVVCLVLGSLGTIAGSPPLPPPPHAH